MTVREQRRWRAAGMMARIVMGKHRRVRGDTKPRWLADDDPLAWWLLTESLFYGVGNA